MVDICILITITLLLYIMINICMHITLLPLHYCYIFVYVSHFYHYTIAIYDRYLYNCIIPITLLLYMINGNNTIIQISII